MLKCGSICQPTSILREVELFPTSTRPARVDTDIGEGFVKGVGNPQSCSSLISELVAAELGSWFGLSIPPFSILSNCDIEIPMMEHNGNIQPPMFFSKAVDGMPRDGGDTFLKRLSNPEDVSKIVIFDTWIRNSDRYVEGNPNSDNLLFETYTKGRKYTLVPIDHSHCFVDVEFDTDLPDNNLVDDPTVYGYYPEYNGYINAKYVADAVRKLEQLEDDFVVQIVNSIPAEWHCSENTKHNLKEFICDRAEFVVETISMKIVDNPELTGL